MERIWTEILGFWPLVVAFGPGLFLFLRFQIKGKEPSREAYIVTIALAYYLLLQGMSYRSDLKRDHKASASCSASR